MPDSYLLLIHFNVYIVLKNFVYIDINIKYLLAMNARICIFCEDFCNNDEKIKLLFIFGSIIEYMIFLFWYKYLYHIQ